MFKSYSHALAIWGVFLGVVYLFGCAPVRYVRPLEKGEMAVTGSIGGPLFKNFGAPVPVPNITIATGYGIKKNLTAFGGVNLLSGAFGNIHLDLGVSKGLLEPERLRPGVTLSPQVNLVAGLNPNGGFRLWPAVDANAWWEYGERKHYCYAGLSVWFVLAGSGPHGSEQPQNILPGLQIGNVWSGEKWDFSVELKWNNFGTLSTDATVDWQPVGSRGAGGIYIGITKRFGK